MREPAGSNAGGFAFDLCKRNAYLADKGVKAPGVWKTGTTIAGVIYKARPCNGQGVVNLPCAAESQDGWGICQHPADGHMGSVQRQWHAIHSSQKQI